MNDAQKFVIVSEPKNKQFRSLAGQTFGRLTVLGYVGSRKKTAVWLCQCRCGKLSVVQRGNLMTGHTRSCACLHSDVASVEKFRHGKCSTTEYNSWAGMMQRCYDPNCHKYKNYGARGITVCERWKEAKNFLEDMGLKPSPIHSIDRIENSGNYEPNNCRWATPREQAQNRRPRSKKSKC